MIAKRRREWGGSSGAGRSFAGWQGLRQQTGGQNGRKNNFEHLGEEVEAEEGASGSSAGASVGEAGEIESGASAGSVGESKQRVQKPTGRRAGGRGTPATGQEKGQLGKIGATGGDRENRHEGDKDGGVVTAAAVVMTTAAGQKSGHLLCRYCSRCNGKSGPGKSLDILSF